MEEFLSGFVSLIGSPNVGKSTLLNEYLGKKIAIVSKKAQTTRNKIVGILTEHNYQIVFLDTPGVHVPHTKLGQFMVQTAYHASSDADISIILIDGKMGLGDRDREIIAKISKNSDFAVAINKIDLIEKSQVAEIIGQLKKMGVLEDRIFAISAKKGLHTDALKEFIISKLIPGPKFYPDDMITDQPERAIAAEMIREKALKLLDKEVPHGIGVDIERFTQDEQKDILYIDAVIYCERNSHKGIIIGKNGSMLKKIGMYAREDLEHLFGQQVCLRTFVKVKADWRNSAFMLKQLGYRQE